MNTLALYIHLLLAVYRYRRTQYPEQPTHHFYVAMMVLRWVRTDSRTATLTLASLHRRIAAVGKLPWYH